MSYTMLWEDTPPEVEAAILDAYERFDAAAEAREEEFPREEFQPMGEEERNSPELAAVEVAYGALRKAAQETGFPLTNWDMKIARKLMSELGMLDDESTPDPYPRLEEYGLEEWPFDAYPPEDSPEGRFLAAEEAVTERDYGGLIPSFKLCSNENNPAWLVTPAEIARSLAAFEASGAPRDVWWTERATVTPVEGRVDRGLGRAAESSTLLVEQKTVEIRFWPDWIDWLEAARAHGGFRVG